MKCDSTKIEHKFFEVKKLAQNAPGSPSFRTDREGILLVCIHCGEVRELWEDGTVIIYPKKIIKAQAYDENSSAGVAKA